MEHLNPNKRTNRCHSLKKRVHIDADEMLRSELAVAGMDLRPLQPGRPRCPDDTEELL